MRPESAPDGKLRPAIAKDGIGCALLEASDARADFGVLVTATFDHLIDDYTDTLAQHTFFTKQDLYKDADDTPIAEPEGNILVINNATTRGGVKPEDPDTVKVYMRHDPNTGAPASIEITVNGNDTKLGEFPAANFTGIRYSWPDDARDVHFSVVKTDDKPFEKKVFVETGPGDDDVSIDSTEFGAVRVNAGDDKVSVTAGSTVTGGPGIDHITGSDHTDFLNGGPEDDTLLGGGAFDSLLGEDGNDRLLDTSPDGNCLSGNDGNDQIIDGPGADFLNGDEAFCGADTAPDPKEDGGFPATT